MISTDHMKADQTKKLIQRVMRVPFFPILLHLDERVQTMQAQAAGNHSEIGGWINFWGHRLESVIRDTADHLEANAQAALQSGLFAERAADAVAGRLDRIEAMLAAPPQSVSSWITDTQIVALPFVFRCLSSTHTNARILCLGHESSTMPLSLAAFGHHVLALNPTGYPWTHPQIEVVEQDLECWPGPDPASLDTIVALSIAATTNLERFHGWLKPAGRLILATPTGTSAIPPSSEWSILKHLTMTRQTLHDWRMTERSTSTPPSAEARHSFSLICAEKR